MPPFFVVCTLVDPDTGDTVSTMLPWLPHLATPQVGDGFSFDGSDFVVVDTHWYYESPGESDRWPGKLTYEFLITASSDVMVDAEDL